MFTDSKFLLPAVGLSITFSVEVNLAWASPSMNLDARQASLPVGWNSLGCYTDSISSRTLNMAVHITPGNMTIESCLAFCTSEGYNKYAGVEYGRECYCDIIIQSPGFPVNATDCNIPCSGNTAQLCGGLGNINIFSHTPLSQVDSPAEWTSLGCYTDSGTSRTLGIASYTSAKDMTIELCFEFCTLAGYTYAGVEFGQECYCDNTIHDPGAPVDSGDCKKTCAGNATEICGNNNRINIFSRSSPSSSPSLSPTSNPTPAITSNSNHIKHVVLPTVLTVLGVILIVICLGAWLRRKRLQPQRKLAIDGHLMGDRSTYESLRDGRE